MLQFIYTDELPEEMSGSDLDPVVAQHLLMAADKFEIPRLRRICEQRLYETVDVDNVFTTLLLAEANGGTELRKKCIQCIAQNLPQLMGSREYQEHVVKDPILMAGLLEAMAEGGGTGDKPDRAKGQTGVQDAPRHSRNAQVTGPQTSGAYPMGRAGAAAGPGPRAPAGGAALAQQPQGNQRAEVRGVLDPFLLELEHVHDGPGDEVDPLLELPMVLGRRRRAADGNNGEPPQGNGDGANVDGRRVRQRRDL